MTWQAVLFMWKFQILADEIKRWSAYVNSTRKTSLSCLWLSEVNYELTRLPTPLLVWAWVAVTTLNLLRTNCNYHSIANNWDKQFSHFIHLAINLHFQKQSRIKEKTQHQWIPNNSRMSKWRRTWKFVRAYATYWKEERNGQHLKSLGYCLWNQSRYSRCSFPVTKTRVLIFYVLSSFFIYLVFLF